MPTQVEVDLRELAVDREEPARRRRGPRQHIVARYVLPGLLIAGFVAVLGWTLRDVLLPGTPVLVVPVHVTRAEMQQAGTPLFKAAGWIEPRPTHIAVAALAPGVVERLLVVEDQPIKKSDPVALLVADDAKLTLKACEADVKLQTAELELAKATLAAAQIRFDRPVHLQAQLAESQAKLAAADTQLQKLPYQQRSAEAQYRFARTDHEGKVRAGDAVAGRVLQQSQSEMDTARELVDQLERQETSLDAEIVALTARRDALKEQLELKTEEKRQLDEARAKRDSAEARLEQVDVAAAEAQLRLDRMTVRAPVDGRVYELWGSPGTRLVAGMGSGKDRDGSTVVTMYEPARLQIRVDVRFDDLPQVRPGQPVLIESPAIAKPLEGEVLFLSSRADIQKNTLEVKVAINAPPEVFKPEMLVDATFLAPKQQQSEAASVEQEQLYVPKQLVRQDGDESFVWIADRVAGVARRVTITTGRRGDSRLVEVLSGLTAAGKLIASPLEGLSDGQRIHITGEDASLGMQGDEL
ncbi:MAG: efflux RND transporter periplasmic adaptor subunit [Candidatus Nealsonbacteria bacterium]|nr:efflux RND transporter periplasmic adaptor subunit [Candidatus Nealsonbacteria bacterium]